MEVGCSGGCSGPFRRRETRWVGRPGDRPEETLTGPGGMYESGENRGLVGLGVARWGLLTLCVFVCNVCYVWGGYVYYGVCECGVCVTCVRVHTHVWRMVLRRYVVVNSLHVLSFSIHTHVMSDSHVLYVYV